MNANRQIMGSRAKAQNPNTQAQTQAREDFRKAQASSPRDGLLDQIRQGRELKKAQDRVLAEPVKLQGGGLQDMIEQRMGERRQAIVGEDEETDTDSSEWE